MDQLSLIVLGNDPASPLPTNLRVKYIITDSNIINHNLSSDETNLTVSLYFFTIIIK